MRDSLEDGEHLVERVEVAEGTLAPRPGEQPGRLIRGRRTLGHGAFRRVEAGGVVGQERVNPGMGAVTDWAVSGQQHGVQALPEQAQRLEVVTEWQGGQGWLKPDGGRDVREHMVPGEQQLSGRVEETEVTTGMAGLRQRLEAPVRQRYRGRAGDPLVGEFPHGRLGRPGTY